MTPATDDELILANELTMDEYDDLVDERVFVLPVGILEEHGSHLPLGTDTFQVEAVVHEAAKRTGSVVLPTLSYGNCHSTRPFPGTISLSTDTVKQITIEILEELARHDVESVAIVSGHAGGGHMRALKQGAREVLAENPDMTIALLSEWALLFAKAGEDLNGMPVGLGHAGTMETARILNLRPDLVGDTPGEHLPEEEPFVLSANPDADMPDGYIGNPKQATAALGQGLHEEAVDALVDLFEDIKP
jgi:creatinine amidohydrolase